MKLWHKLRNLGLALLNACLAGAIKLFYKLCDRGLILIDICCATAVKLWRKLYDWTLILIDVGLAGGVAALLSWGVVKLLIHIDPSFVLKDLAFVMSAIIILVGWYTTARLNHKNEIAKRRLDYRLEMLKSFLPIARTIFENMEKGKDPFTEDKKLGEKLNDAQFDFYTFGYGNEIKMIENFVSALKSMGPPESANGITPTPDPSKFKAAWEKMIPGVFNKIRAELEMGKIPQNTFAQKIRSYFFRLKRRQPR